MSNRSQIDSVIDDDDEFCPLCIEEFDLSDKNFKPCPCGYQICQFCYNNIKTHSEEGRCPNCRRVYDESAIQYKVPDADEFKADLALKHRKAAAAKKKEQEKREVENSNRKNLAGVRVVQKNLVYVIGLNPTIRDEAQLLQTLRGPEYFGQYGEIEKIVVSKAKPGGNPNQGIGVYVTFARKADAAACIAAVDGSQNGDRILRAQYGTTKYCSAFLRGEQCNNRNCSFLHETGDDNETYSRQDLSSVNTAQRHGHHQNGAHRPAPQPVQPQPMRRQGSKDEPAGKSGQDGSALPSSASWANKDGPLNRARRASVSGNRSSPSPKPAAAATATSKTEDGKRPDKQQAAQDSRRPTPVPSQQPTSNSQSREQTAPARPEDVLLENLVKAIKSPAFRFVFSTDGLSEEDIKFLETGPSFIDPFGGAKRRAMREKAEQERAKQEAEAQSMLRPSSAGEEENREGGSSQLGGEPDDVHSSRGAAAGNREVHGAIQPPSQHGTASNSAVGSPASLSQQFQNLNINGRSLTPLQQQQLMLLKSANGQQAGALDHIQLDQSSQTRQGLLQGSLPQNNSIQGHGRQSSRFSFANDTNAKNPRVLGQQGSVMQSASPSALGAPAPQQGLANQFYTGSVQGPPPGLKTAGTPPISGGGMFSQGHGFTTNANLGVGANVGKQDANPELMRELLRGRGGTGTGGVQGHEAAKREFMFSLQQHQSPPPLTPTTTGLLNAFYGSQAGTLADSGPQKQKKKGKKQRHANTSSGGGGVVDLADPSILQARMHQIGVGATGQTVYGSQGQVDDNEFPPLSVATKAKNDASLRSQTQSSRSGTPSVPPGLPLPPGHPAAAVLQGTSAPHSPASSTISLPTHPPPGLSLSRRATPIQKPQDSISRHATPVSQEEKSNAATAEKALNPGDVSFGSPQMKPGKKNALGMKLDRTESPSPAPTKDSSSGETGQRQERATSKKAKPIKLNLALVDEPIQIPATKEEPAPSISTASVPAGTTATATSQPGSRPNTPLTGISRVSDSSGPRQPRVIRVVDTPKTETPPPPAAQSSSSNTQVKGRSRRPSLTSSGTPVDATSDFEAGNSASGSRASSPPPSRIGSAPVRTISKSQAKKERRLKAKQAEEAMKEEAAAAAAVEEQAPIIGRKRKTKKTPAPSSEPSATSDGKGSEQAAEKDESKTDGDRKATKDKPANDAKTANGESEEKQPAEAWRSNNTIEQMVKDAKESGRSIKELFQERTSPLHVLLAQLNKAAEIDLHTHPLFNPPTLSQRTDMKCTAEDYDRLKQPLELTSEHKKMLLRGEPVRINDGSDAPKNRCLITPRGCVLRHLSPAEEDRYLELERRMSSENMQEFPAISMADPDPTNMAGGLDALFATPEKFNIRWVDDNQDSIALAAGAVLTGGDDLSLAATSGASAPNVLSTTDANGTGAANNGDLLSSTSASVRSFAAATAKQMLGVTGTSLGQILDLDEVQAMTDEELRAYIERSQRELEQSRKEFDAIDKKFNALVKRNKKLAQQALAATVEAAK